MNSTVTIFRWVVRLCGVLALLLGLGFWAGHGNMQLLQLHQGLGYLAALSLLAVSVLSFGKVPVGLSAAGVLWALLVPALGHMQTTLLPGNNHWIVEVLHLILGVGAIGLTEALGGRMNKAAARVEAAPRAER